MMSLIYNMYDYRLKTFIAVADCQSFTKAASAVNLSVSAVIKQITTLEEEFDTVLFDRRKTGVTLTEDGLYFYQCAHNIINLSADYTNRLPSRTEHPHTIRIANPQIYYPKTLKTLTNAYHESHPNIIFQILPYFDSETLDLDLNSILERFDMIYFLDKTNPESSEIKYTPFENIPFVCAVVENCDLCEFSAITPVTLENRVISMPVKGLNHEVDRIRDYLIKHIPGIQILERDGKISDQDQTDIILIPSVLSIFFTHRRFIPFHPDITISAGIFSHVSAPYYVQDFIRYCSEQFVETQNPTETIINESP
ncbi:MAG: LysR family transcriptional regulator [Bulleidia sp.]